MHIAQTAILCYKVILKLVFRSVETAQVLQQQLGLVLESKVAVLESREMNAYVVFSAHAVYRPAKLPLPSASRFITRCRVLVSAALQISVTSG